MVLYASFGNFCSNSRNFQNFDSPVIFNIILYKSSYISINSCNTLGIYRMRYFFFKFFPSWVCMCVNSCISLSYKIDLNWFFSDTLDIFEQNHIDCKCVMQDCGHWWVKTAKNFVEPKMSTISSKIVACMLATFSMSALIICKVGSIAPSGVL